MKCTIPEISWHNREPVLSVDINPVSEKFYRLATGGSDCHILIWQLNLCDNGAVKIEALSDLTRHQKAVNCVKWSKSGNYLASADDDANIIVWQLKTDNIPSLDGETNDKETWKVYKVMRGHKEDVYDLCWSPNDEKLLSGSIDNTAIVWDLVKGKSEHILQDHKGFVQGVAWDPKGHYLATISTDRVCRIFNSNKKQVLARIQKGQLPVSEAHCLHKKDVKYFHDDTFKSYFRRLDFSVDGTLLAVPSGCVDNEDLKKPLHASYIFAVDSWTEPIIALPSLKQSSTVVRFCPVLFELRETGPDAAISLPYRLILAVGTDHDVILYDTQQGTPFAYYRDIHYTRLTDLTWSRDGRLLVASSTDGFCALITFADGELGAPRVRDESDDAEEASVLEISGCEEVAEGEERAEGTPKSKKPSFLEKWTIKTPKSGERFKPDSPVSAEKINKLVPKRITPILVEAPSKVVDKLVASLVAKDVAEDNGEKSFVEPKKVGTRVKKQPVKKSPMLKFLKKGAVKKKVVTRKSDDDVIILDDEVEARDAWKCEKEIDKMVVDISDNSEDFSLHLEESIDGKSGTEKTKEKSEEAVKKANEKIASDKEVLSNCPAVQKRRIPLITLSSPKQKKK